jgi:putative inorganic carbon (HCO3(-)) transporter
MSRLYRQLSWNSPLFQIALVGLAALYGLALARLSSLNAFLLVFFSLVGVGTLIEPLVGLLATLFLGLLWAWLRAELPTIPPLIAMPVLALTLASWLARGAARREVRLPRPPLLLPLALFVGAAALSLWDGVELPVYGLPELLKWLQILALFWLVVDHVDARRLPWLVGGLLLIGVFQAAVGLWQFGLRGTGPEHYAILNGRFYRAYGTFEQPNPYAGYLGLVFPLGVGLVVSLVHWYIGNRYIGRLMRRSQSTNLPIYQFTKLIALLLATVLIGAALVASWSRGAWLGAVAAALAMVAALPRRAWLGLGLVALLLVGTLGLDVMGVLPASVSARLTDFGQYVRFEDVRGVGINDANYAVIERLAHWQAALEMWRANFWNGVGFGDYEPAYPDYRLLNWPIALGHAHNYYLNVAAETGVIGLVAYLLLWGAVFWQTWRVTRRFPVGDWRRGLAIGLLGAWAHLSVHHLFDNLYVNNVHLHVGVMLGLVAVLGTRAGVACRKGPGGVQFDNSEGFWVRNQ